LPAINRGGGGRPSKKDPLWNCRPTQALGPPKEAQRGVIGWTESRKPSNKEKKPKIEGRENGIQDGKLSILGDALKKNNPPESPKKSKNATADRKAKP